eukprot:TRINITY_DN5973_c0_g1_i1.p1 TRINITY_DN5973_c0_g1~~TRINITY_DN5973_c0_g1_i1.p1  ORF type:complete len:65 (-),score=6.17 TRINITY_DN5973_c0_g1_i1:65-259(-)
MWLIKRNKDFVAKKWLKVPYDQERRRLQEVRRRIREGVPFRQRTPLWYLIELLNYIWASEQDGR